MTTTKLCALGGQSAPNRNQKCPCEMTPPGPCIHPDRPARRFALLRLCRERAARTDVTLKSVAKEKP